ncbi:hypothetical protein D3C80_2083630 [compost metagenome]
MLIGLLSILPTKLFLGWRSDVKAGQLPQLSAPRGRLVTLVIRLELLLLLILPLLAALLARGFGVIG